MGSTSYITTKNGSISQHVEYIAFGEFLFEEHSSSFSSPYLFNGKELDRETNLSYYGSRYYSPKENIWYGLDKMAEKYPDFGGYIYAFNNPVRFIDPDGSDPKPVYNGFSNVLNVLSGKKWIPYMSKTIKESEWNFSWGRGFYKQTSCRTGECADYSRLQVNQGSSGKYTAVGSKNRVDMYVKKGGDTSKLNLQKGVDTIIENLNEGKAVMAGVMYDSNKNTGNPNSATNHYITIVGMGRDKDGAYFSYYDNYAGEGHREQTKKNVGTDIVLNKFRLSQTKDGTYYFSDGADGNIPYNQNKKVEVGNQNKQPARYILTEVRDNE